MHSVVFRVGVHREIRNHLPRWLERRHFEAVQVDWRFVVSHRTGGDERHAVHPTVSDLFHLLVESQDNLKPLSVEQPHLLLLHLNLQCVRLLVVFAAFVLKPDSDDSR